MAQQATLKNKVTFNGIGLHSGQDVSMTLRPAEAGTGIVFHRTDISPSVSIEAVASNVVSTRLSTTIGHKGATVSTIEHLMAALHAYGIDNVHIDIDSAEVPIMDGSAKVFIAEMQKAGRRVLSQSRKYLVVKKAVTVVDGDKKATLLPASSFGVSFNMSFGHPAVGSQSRTMKLSEGEFAGDYAGARTFCFLAEVEYMKANGLARGGSLENAVVIGDEGVLNPEGLRFDDEFVRHKILDAVGDFYLAGVPIIGHVKATKSGHDLNHKLVTELLSRKDCWKLVDSSERPHMVAPFPMVVPELAWSEA